MSFDVVGAFYTLKLFIKDEVMLDFYIEVDQV